MIFVCISSFGELKETWRIIDWILLFEVWRNGEERDDHSSTPPLSLYRIVRLCLDE